MENLQSWSIATDFGIIVRELDEEYLAFHCGSGDTHRLGTEAGFVLTLLGSRKAVMHIEALLDEAKRSGFERLDIPELEAILQSLSSLYLVKSC